MTEIERCLPSASIRILEMRKGLIHYGFILAEPKQTRSAVPEDEGLLIDSQY